VGHGLRTGEKEFDTMLLMTGDPRKTVADYISKFHAPAKKLDIVPGAGHFVMWTHPDGFLNLLREDVASGSIKPGVSN
jgi:pimeloyl-ACP methyl ester carboxylesterase